MDCDDAEDSRDLLRHKNSNVTRSIYRSHFDDRRREALRSRMEARMEAAGGSGPQQATDHPEAEVVPLRDLAIVTGARKQTERLARCLGPSPVGLRRLGRRAPS